MAIMQDIAKQEQARESLALLKLLAQGKRSIEDSGARPFRRVIEELRSGLAKSRARSNIV